MLDSSVRQAGPPQIVYPPCPSTLFPDYRVRSWAGSPTPFALQPDQGPISFEFTIGCYNANVTPLFILYIGTLCLLFLDQLKVNGISDIFKELAFGFIGFSFLYFCFKFH